MTTKVNHDSRFEQLLGALYPTMRANDAEESRRKFHPPDAEMIEKHLAYTSMCIYM